MLRPIKTSVGIALASLLVATACAAPRPAAMPVVARDLISSKQLPTDKPIAEPGDRIKGGTHGDVYEFHVPPASYVTRLVRRDSLTPKERAEMLQQARNSHGDPEMFDLPEVFVFTELAHVIGEKDPRACSQPPPDIRSVRLNLAPDMKVADLIAWIASVTCRQFILPASLDGRMVMVAAPQSMTPDEAYRLFFTALGSVGLTVDESGNIARVVEAVR